MLHLLPMPPTCMALSDTGLCAVASGGLLAVADARSQEMVVRAGFGAHDFFSRQIGDRLARELRVDGGLITRKGNGFYWDLEGVPHCGRKCIFSGAVNALNTNQHAE